MALLNVSYYSHALTRNTDLTVILPVGMPDFIPMPRKAVPRDLSKPFPTIYLLHGYSGTNADWLRYTRIELFSMLYNVAVVCPSGENSFYLDDRMRDAHYTRLVCDELIDFTRRIFPLSHRREDTLIGGLSMGGYGAIRNGLLRSDVFGTVIALSSALITDRVAEGRKEEYDMISPEYYIHTFGPREKIKGSDMDPEALINRIVSENLPRPNLYVAIGTEDPLLDFNRQFHGWLEKAGYDHVYIEDEGSHDWVFWDRHIEKALIWYNEQNKRQ
jgi:S-formylglutathione hydrolase FrmB